MPFGKFKGRLLSELPDGYLLWLLDLPDLNPWLRRALEIEMARRDDGPRPPGRQEGVIALADLRPLVKRWFGELSLRWHPDRGGTQETMQAVNQAHDRLRELLGLK
jgi:hypothetical protein